MSFLHLLFAFYFLGEPRPSAFFQKTEKEIVYDLFRLRNEHKADSAEQYFADTVLVYMKYLRNVPRERITQLDRIFFKSHPKNKFEITAPVHLTTLAGITTAMVIGKEYIDGTSFVFERIETGIKK
jgi:hypothetical protein